MSSVGGAKNKSTNQLKQKDTFHHGRAQGAKKDSSKTSAKKIAIKRGKDKDKGNKSRDRITIEEAKKLLLEMKTSYELCQSNLASPAMFRQHKARFDSIFKDKFLTKSFYGEDRLADVRLEILKLSHHIYDLGIKVGSEKNSVNSLKKESKPAPSIQRTSSMAKSKPSLPAKKVDSNSSNATALSAASLKKTQGMHTESATSLPASAASKVSTIKSLQNLKDAQIEQMTEADFIQLITRIDEHFSNAANLDLSQLRSTYLSVLNFKSIRYQGFSTPVPYTLTQALLKMEKELILHGLLSEEAKSVSVPRFSASEMQQLTDEKMQHLLKFLALMVLNNPSNVTSLNAYKTSIQYIKIKYSSEASLSRTLTQEVRQLHQHAKRRGFTLES